MANIQELLVQIDASTESLRRELKKADQAVAGSSRKIDGQLAKMDKSFARFSRMASRATAALGAFGVAAGGGAVANLAKQAISSTAEMGRMADALGVSTTRLQELNYTFQQFNADSNDTADALATLADRAQDALSGTKSMIDDFALLGISVDQLRGKRPDEIFYLVAQAVSRVEDPTARAAAVVRTFGDDLGRRLLPMLMEGREGLERYAKAAHDTGNVLREELIDAADEVDRKFKELTTTIGNNFKRVVLETVEAVRKLNEEARKTIEANPEMAARIGSGRLIGGAPEETDKPQAKPKPATLGPILPPLELEEFEEAERKITTVLAGLGTLEEAQRSAAQVFDETRTPLERYNAETERLGLMLSHGLLDWETYTRAMEGAREEMESLSGATPGLQDMLNDLSVAAEGFGRNFEDSIVQAAKTGELSFRDMANAILEDLLRITLRMAIIRPLVAGITGGLGGMFEDGAVFQQGRVTPFAKGGVVDGPTLFPMANGAGLMGEAGPEAIMPLKRGSDGKLGVSAAISGTAAPEIHIHNEGEPLTAERAEMRTGPDGRQQLHMWVREEVKRAIGSGALDRTMSNTYGLRRRGS